MVMTALPALPVHAAKTPLFTIHLIVPTNNPKRVIFAGMIAASFNNAGIDAEVTYMSFGQMLNRVWPPSCPCGQLYDQGGYDAIFVGWGGGSAVPDLALQTNYRYLNANDVPNIGSNYAFYLNPEVNQIMVQYGRTFDPEQRTDLAQHFVKIVAHDRPYSVILYPKAVYAWKNYILPWGQPSPNIGPSLPDMEHWKVLPGHGDTANIAIRGYLNDLNPLPSVRSNTIFDRYVWADLYSPLEIYNPITQAYQLGSATSITSTPDHLRWTVTFTPHTFQDSASVTSDDYLFTYLANLVTTTGSVNLPSFQQILGKHVQFTFLNGTIRYVSNGNYFTTQPAGWVPDASFAALAPTSFTFHLGTPYAFTDPVVTGIYALPMHILRQIPFGQWDTNFFSTLQNTPTTVTWNPAKFGGNGSYAHAFGPVGDGPYVYRGYDSSTSTATLVRYNQYWNASGLQALGEFGIGTAHLVTIPSTSGVISAFQSGTVNFVDTNYFFSSSDLSTLESTGNSVVISPIEPFTGWQEMGLNMNSPIWGTGTATPRGQMNPSQASLAAYFVRKALSYLIPRQQIIDQLLPGLAEPGITQLSPFWSSFYPPNVRADPYNPEAAMGFLRAAGYSV
jgi:ABC-type transport system substrate-binding protein